MIATRNFPDQKNAPLSLGKVATVYWWCGVGGSAAHPTLPYWELRPWRGLIVSQSSLSRYNWNHRNLLGRKSPPESCARRRHRQISCKFNPYKCKCNKAEPAAWGKQFPSTTKRRKLLKCCSDRTELFRIKHGCIIINKHPKEMFAASFSVANKPLTSGSEQGTDGRIGAGRNNQHTNLFPFSHRTTTTATVTQIHSTPRKKKNQRSRSGVHSEAEAARPWRSTSGSACPEPSHWDSVRPEGAHSLPSRVTSLPAIPVKETLVTSANAECTWQTQGDTTAISMATQPHSPAPPSGALSQLWTLNQRACVFGLLAPTVASSHYFWR